jgi:hypothetical protein
MKIRDVGADLFHADGQTVTTRPIVAFRNYATAPRDRSVKAVNTTTNLLNIYISGVPTQVEHCASYNCPHVASTNTYYTCTQGTPTEIQTPAHGELDRPQNDRPVVRVIAQQYSSATFFSLRFHPKKEKHCARFKNVISFSTL